jgi:iron(III) transport system permease protein
MEEIMHKENRENKVIFGVISLVFIAFLLIPTLILLSKSFESNGSFSIINYKNMLLSDTFKVSLKNSVLVSTCTAFISTCIAFILAYTVNNTNINHRKKYFIKNVTTLPMLLPTITYGFAIIYSFGKQGLITKILGFELFNIYGFNGLLLGYIIYTLPISFLLINNTFKYIDKSFIVVSRVMGDKPIKTFYITIFKPLIGTIVGAFIQSFFLSFTDFGIPASVGGNFNVISTTLYTEMLGSIPNFNNGAVIAMVMLIPSAIGIFVLTYLEKYNFRYDKISQVEIQKNKLRDIIFQTISLLIVSAVLSIFAVIFIVPFVNRWPYDISPTFENIKNIIQTLSLSKIYINSIIIALLTAILGTIIAYGSAILVCRSDINKNLKLIIESIAVVTNTIPGMVLGIAFLLTFSGTSIQNTFAILIICNIIHFFSTPYLMIKNSLSKMNASFETISKLLGDSYIKTLVRIITPNIKSTLFEVISYYFVNSMVTISAVIFLTSANTMVLTTKIKELQHYAKFDEIFVLSTLILITNIVVKLICNLLVDKEKIIKYIRKINKRDRIEKMKFKSKFITSAVLLLSIVTITVGCTPKKSDKVVIYSNADEEVVVAMTNALDSDGYKGKYIIQSFGTSELGGKILSEGKNIEADIITMSSYYEDTVQDKNKMFVDLGFEKNTIENYPDYQAPITALQGTLIVNTEVLKEKNLEAPKSIKDLSDKKYEGLVSIPDITGSSTGWLLIQGLLSKYPEKEAKEIMSTIIKNAGPHLESSGSAPIKKVRSGEVAIAFGLRHQAVKDKQDNLPIDYIDPVEGNFQLVESIAVVDKNGDEKEKLAKEMSECIVKNARGEISSTYQNVLYKGEEIDSNIAAKYPKSYKEKLTVELLEKHKKFFENSKN